MKKHILAISLIFVIIGGLITPVFANGNLRYQEEAKKLYELSLYKGISEDTYEPDLEGMLTREQSTIILLRLIGEEDDALKMTQAEVKIALAPFKDAKLVSDWAKNQVAYAVKKEIMKGYNGLLDPQGGLKGIQYASLLLQAIGEQDFEYRSALDKLVVIGALKTGVDTIRFDKEQLTRDDVVGLSYAMLTVKTENGKTMIENLVENGEVSRVKAEELGLVEPEAPVVTEEPIETTEPEIPVETEEPIETTEPEVPVETEEPIETTEPEVPVVTEEPVETTKPETPVVTVKPEEPKLYRASGAVKVGQWTISNGSRETILVDKIYLTAVYGGQTSALKPAYVTDYSIEDTEGNVYATFDSISNTKGITLQKKIEIAERTDSEETSKDICVYAKINDRAVYGGTIELFLGDGTFIFEGTGKITGTRLIKKGAVIAQEDGKITISMSKVLPKMYSYNKEPQSMAGTVVGAFELNNLGPKSILMEKIILEELINTTGNVNYTLKNGNMKTVATATVSGGKIEFNIAGGQKISANKSEVFTVEMDDVIPVQNRVQLKLLKEGTCYDSLNDEGYGINIDEDLVLDAIVTR